MLGTKYVDQREKNKHSKPTNKTGLQEKKRTLQPDLAGNFLLRCRDVKDRQLSWISVPVGYTTKFYAFEK